MNKTLRTVLTLVLAAVLAVSAGMVIRNLHTAAREDRANQALAQQVHDAQEQNPQTGAGQTAPEADGPAQDAVLPQLQALHDQNPDLAGWLTIPDTPIDYPVMYTPEDRDYYLRRAFDGSYALSGTLFIGTPWTEGHTLIYGHHMKNGTMFGSLEAYADPAYRDSHPTIDFSTLYEEKTYEVMACFQTRAVVSDDIFPYWDYTDLSDPDRFQTYVDQVLAAALYDTGVRAAWGDELLTLSTCSYHASDGRFVVVAKRTDASPRP